MSSLPKTSSRPGQSTSKQNYKKIWYAPASRAKWYWLLVSGTFYLLLFTWYQYALHTGQEAEPFEDPFRLFGICAFVLVLLSASYTLRRRFARALPGKVQSWLWMHTWLGIITILVALLHENYAYITHDFLQVPNDLLEANLGPIALFALILLVFSGIAGRLFDQWQTRKMAHEAATNGVGIAQAVEERVRHLEETAESLCAGKSDAFKEHCQKRLQPTNQQKNMLASLSGSLTPRARSDLQRAEEALDERARLLISLQHLQQSQRLIRRWRMLHILIASLSLLIITYHSIMELSITILHITTIVPSP
ncbi:hypothetical protein [Ktedonospora formicarum]|uniref:Uncharacterized protein n=1 Tax=Ktedonospora formicarum TaxID=2778364 RepID=A0A8J3MTC9_9CHLR|nr:hypothetical protein [Ktedonospora formicarum]GHO44225.1 hypothetical protein KSX_23880 [Ktedonospora formicarum]